MANIEQIMAAIAGQIAEELADPSDPLIENLQTVGMLVFNPTPPAIDVYPGEPFMEPSAMGGRMLLFFTVRARVSTADNAGGQSLLLSMMDPSSTTSVAEAIASDRTLGGTVGKCWVSEGPSSYGVFPNLEGNTGSLLGCTWRVGVIP